MCNCATTTTPAATVAMQGHVFKVEDMTCSHCAGTIRNALKEGMPGSEFSIDMENQQVTVAGDAAMAETIIRDAGYEPKLLVSQA